MSAEVPLPQPPGLSVDELAEAQTFIIREIPDKMRRSFLGAFAGTATVALNLRDRWSTPITYRQTDPLTIVGKSEAEVQEAGEMEAHEVASVFIKEELDRRSVTFRHHNSRLIFGEREGDECIVEYMTMNRIPQRGHSIHAQNIDQIEYITRTCLVSEEDFAALRGKGFPYLIRATHAGQYEERIHFEHNEQHFYLDKDNTTVRRFEDPKYNHVEVDLGEGEKMRIFGAKAEEMTVELFNAEFAQEYSPKVDGPTMRLFEKAQESELKRQRVQKLFDEVEETGGWEEWAILEAEGLDAAHPEASTGSTPVTFIDAFIVLNSERARNGELGNQATAAYDEAKQFAKTRELVSKKVLFENEETEAELQRNFPALAKLRADFMTELDAYVARGTVEATTAKNMIVGFDSVLNSAQQEPAQRFFAASRTTSLGRLSKGGYTSKCLRNR